MYAEFIRFYHYTAEEALNEYAKRFFALCSQMYRVKAKESLSDYMVNAAVQSGQDGKKVVEELQKQEKGIEGIIQEVKYARGES